MNWLILVTLVITCTISYATATEEPCTDTQPTIKPYPTENTQKSTSTITDEPSFTTPKTKPTRVTGTRMTTSSTTTTTTPPKTSHTTSTTTNLPCHEHTDAITTISTSQPQTSKRPTSSSSMGMSQHTRSSTTSATPTSPPTSGSTSPDDAYVRTKHCSMNDTCELCTFERCPLYFVYDPKCGKKQRSDGYWNYRIFDSQCEMDNANLCGGGYVPCCWFKEMMVESIV